MQNKKDNLLLKIPVFTKKTSITKEKNGQYSIKYKRNTFFEKILTFVFNAPKEIFIELDKKGSEVVKYIDGKKNLFEIYKLSNGEIEEKKLDAFVKFIQILKIKNFITWQKTP